MLKFTENSSFYFNLKALPTLIPNITEMEDCPVRHTPEFLVFLSFPTASIIVNVVNLLAIIMHRRQLRQNNVYYYVSNTLLANVVLSLLSVYQIFGQYFSIDGHAEIEHAENQGKVRQSSKLWWAFHRALFIALFLVMCCNIGVLVWAIKDTVHGPLLFGSRALEVSNDDRKLKKRGRKMVKMLTRFNRKKRHRRVWFFIVLMWLLPLCYAMSVLVGWSCASECICLEGCYSSVHTDGHAERHCSRVWPPMKYNWLLISVIAWLLCVVAVVSILCRTFFDTKRHFRFCRDRMRTSKEPSTVALALHKGSKTARYGSSNDSTTPPMHIKHPSENSLVKSHHVLRRTLRSLRHLIWITVLFVLCTSPVMALFYSDFSSVKSPSVWVGTTCLCVPLVYCCLCPLLLSRCLPGIRLAQRSLVMTMFKTRKGKTQTKRATARQQKQETFSLKTRSSPSRNRTVAFRVSQY